MPREIEYKWEQPYIPNLHLTNELIDPLAKLIALQITLSEKEGEKNESKGS